MLALLLAGCQRASGPSPRYAFVRFENLSGDPAIEWTARAASEFLSRSLAGALDGPVLSAPSLNRAGSGLGASPANVPGESNDRAKAELAGANRLVSGYIERVDGKIRVSASEENLVNHRTVRILSAEADQPIAAIRQLANEFSPSARPYLTSNSDVLRLYVTASEGPSSSAIPDLQEATQKDPAFGPAWVALVDVQEMRGDRTASLEAAEAALRQKLDPADRAAIQLQKAALENDRPARLIALNDLAKATSGDLVLLRTLAEGQTAAGQFAQAAATWKKVREAAPGDRNAWNQAGYALAWSGDFSGAIHAMKEYAARWPADPNPLDSTGDVYYMYGKFADAAANYLKGNEKNSQFLTGGELYKAAWAQFRAGDKVKAESSFEQFQSVRRKSDPASLTLFAADWLYRTGREKQALAFLRRVAEASSKPGVESQLWSQIVIWDLMAKDRATAQRDAAVEATKPASNIAIVARFSALPSATVAEWESRADTMLRGPGIESARRFALGVALILDGKREAARPIWDEIVEADASTDFFARAVDARLKGEKPKLEIVPDPLAVNQLRALPDQL